MIFYHWETWNQDWTAFPVKLLRKQESIQGSGLVHQTENIRTDSHSGVFWPSELRNSQNTRLKKPGNDPLRALTALAPSVSFCLFSLPSWRQDYSLCGNHFPVPMLMANLSKLTHLDPQTTVQPRLEPGLSLQHSCLAWCSQQRQIASHWCIYQQMPSWFAVIPYTLLIFKTQMPPCSQ